LSVVLGALEFVGNEIRERVPHAALGGSMAVLLAGDGLAGSSGPAGARRQGLAGAEEVLVHG